MRRWFLLVIIVLLPLRGWVGDAMAVQMMEQHTAVVAAAPVTHAPGQDCLEHGDATKHSVKTAAPDCPTCASCQVCSAVAVIFAQAPAVSAIVAAALLPETSSYFASAVPAPAFKPPIS